MGGVQYQRVKIDVGADGASSPVVGALPVTAASLPLPAGAATSAAQATLDTHLTDGSARIGGTVTITGALTDTQLRASPVPISGTVTANAGTGPWPVTDNGGSLTVDNAGTFAVQDSEKVADRGTFTQGTSKVMPAGYILDEVAGTALSENMPAAARINANRSQVGVIEDGATRAQYMTVTAAGAAKVDGSAVTQPVSVAALPLPAGAAQEHATAGSPHSVRLTDGSAFYDAAKTGQLPSALVGGRLDVNVGASTSIAVTNAGTFAVQDSQVITDNAGFTDGTSKVFLGGYIFDEVAGTALTENDAAAARVDSKRAQVHVIEDATTRGQRLAVTAAGAAKVDGSAVTQPVSGTVTANLGTLNGAALDASVTGLQVAQGSTTSGQKGGLALGAVTTGNPSYTTAQTSPLSLDTAGALRVRIAASDVSSSGGTSAADGAAYVAGTTAGTPMMGARDDTSPGVLAEDKVGIVRLSTRREMYTQIRDGAGNERGANVTAAGALQVDASATTQPVSGTVTANAGTGPWPVTDNGGSLTVDNGGTFAVQDSQKVVDNASFTDGTTPVQPAGFIFDEVAGTALTENDAAAARVDAKRAQVLTIEDATTRGQRAAVSAAGRLSVDASGVAVPVTDNSSSLTVDAPVGTPVAARLSDGTSFLTTSSGRLAVDPSGVTSPVSIAAAVSEKNDVVAAVTAAWTSATSIDTTASITVTGYATVLLTINPTSTFTAGAIIFEVSDDGGTTWYPIQGVRVDSFTSETSYTIVASTKRIWQFDVAGATTFRVRLNPAITGTGTLNLRMQASAAATDPQTMVGGTVTAQDGGGSLTIDAPVGTPVFVAATPATTGGWTHWSTSNDNSNTDLSTTVVTVKGSQGVLGGWVVYNPNATVAYVQIFDVSGTVTLGTTRPHMFIPIPATSGANLEMTNGVQFANAIKIAATTTPSGSTAPGTAIPLTLMYK